MSFAALLCSCIILLSMAIFKSSMFSPLSSSFFFKNPNKALFCFFVGSIFALCTKVIGLEKQYPRCTSTIFEALFSTTVALRSGLIFFSRLRIGWFPLSYSKRYTSSATFSWCSINAFATTCMILSFVISLSSVINIRLPRDGRLLAYMKFPLSE